MAIGPIVGGKVRTGRWRPGARVVVKPTRCAYFGVGAMWPPGEISLVVQFANYVLTVGLSDWEPV